MSEEALGAGASSEAEGIESAAKPAHARSEGTISDATAAGPAHRTSPDATLAAALARAAAAALDAGDEPRARALLADALRVLRGPASLCVVRNAE